MDAREKVRQATLSQKQKDREAVAGGCVGCGLIFIAWVVAPLLGIAAVCWIVKHVFNL